MEEKLSKVTWVRLSKKTKEKIVKYAEREGILITELIRTIIREMVVVWEREEKKLGRPISLGELIGSIFYSSQKVNKKQKNLTKIKKEG